MRRVLDNLLDNAVKFSESGDALELDAASDDAAALVVRVRDHGMGIAKEDLGRVFEPFFRGDRSRTRASGGVGLGLTIARRVVEAHGGEISVESARPTGTCFTIRLAGAPSGRPSSVGEPGPRAPRGDDSGLRARP
jgi:signal transduction histidine kinase